jgi:hypothetical protein
VTVLIPDGPNWTSHWVCGRAAARAYGSPCFGGYPFCPNFPGCHTSLSVSPGQASITTGTIIGRRRCVASTHLPNRRRTNWVN